MKKHFLLFALFSLLATALPGQSAEGEGEEKSTFQQLIEAIFGAKEAASDELTIEEKYGPFLSFIHGDELQLYDSLRQLGVVNWDQYQRLEDVHFTYADTSLAPNIQVFGWHPYWMGTAYEDYNYNLLSHVSWFAYHIDPNTGGYINPDVIAGWRSGAFQEVARAQNPNTKLLITVASHTKAGNRQFLDNKDGQFQNLADTLVQLLADGQGDGIDVNFELMPRGYEKRMTDFLEYLHSRLVADSLDYMLTVVLPKVNSPRVYDIERLQKFVDYFLITGYDYHTGDSPRDGPIAPLRSDGPYSIENTVYSYLEDGMDRDKLILGLPYYGGVWEGQVPAMQSQDTTLRFVGHRTYRMIEAEYAWKVPPSYDLKSWSAYYLLPNEEDTTLFTKIWFDDSTTLDRKYDWVLENELGGIGIWALGYDHGDTTLWKLIEKKYAADTIVTFHGPYLDRRFFSLADTLYNYQTLVVVAAVFVVLFVVLGLIASLYDWRVREVFFSNKTLRAIYILASFAVVLGVLFFVSYVSGKPIFSGDNMLFLLLGLLGGGLLTVLIGRWFNRKRSQLP